MGVSRCPLSSLVQPPSTAHVRTPRSPHLQFSTALVAIMSRRRTAVAISCGAAIPRHSHSQDIIIDKENLAPALRAWVQSLAAQHGVSEELVIGNLCKVYGPNGVEVAKDVAEKNDKLPTTAPETLTQPVVAIGVSAALVSCHHTFNGHYV